MLQSQYLYIATMMEERDLREIYDHLNNGANKKYDKNRFVHI